MRARRGEAWPARLRGNQALLARTVARLPCQPRTGGIAPGQQAAWSLARIPGWGSPWQFVKCPLLLASGRQKRAAT